MPRFERRTLIDKFQGMVPPREPIVGGGAGTGLSAKCEEAGGIVISIVYTYIPAATGWLGGDRSPGSRLRQCNEIVVEMAREVLPVTKKTPVLAGVNGTDPFCLSRPFSMSSRALVFSGVQNFPTVGLFDGSFRANLEETGMAMASRST